MAAATSFLSAAPADLACNEQTEVPNGKIMYESGSDYSCFQI